MRQESPCTPRLRPRVLIPGLMHPEGRGARKWGRAPKQCLTPRESADLERCLGTTVVAGCFTRERTTPSAAVGQRESHAGPKGSGSNLRFPLVSG